jgi:hypothetical protein
MTVATNPLCRLAPRTQLQSCVHSIHQASKAAPEGLPMLPIKACPCSDSTSSSTRGNDSGTQGYLLKHETAFNIHNPSITHRVR